VDCLDDDTVLAFVQGTLGAERTARVHAHLQACGDCHILVAEAAKFVHAEPDAPPAAAPEGAPDAPPVRPPDGAPPPLPPGAAVSRYVVEEPLGIGATGVVYRAYDPQLKRKVALKLLRPGSEPSRLLREAEAMARLSHPNVVNVFDAGTYEAQVFIVMELVEGETLAQWLRRGPRGWREILAAFVEAGRGLAAAHAAALVHRDFKPDNVLAGADGRVRVTDFGLARSFEGATGADDPASTTKIELGSATMTARAGTPIYMSPEQLLGSAADARADQFSFCVALHLALCGRHPFGGAGPNLLNLAREIEAAEIGAGRGEGELPRALRDVLARGLSLKPEGRHPSMDALVRALEEQLRPPEAPAAAPAPRRRPRPWAIAAAAAAALAAAVGLGRMMLASAGFCGDGHVDPTEACDDGNRSDGDGCLASCRWARCGDGKVRTGVEECDDGNTRSGDGCSASCLACRAGAASFAWDETGHCYSRHDGPETWTGAAGRCAAAGGHLVTYTSTYETRAAWAALFAELAPKPRSWIGLSVPPADRSGSFAWVTQEAIPRLWWAPDEPRGGTGSCVSETPFERLQGSASVVAASAWHVTACDQRLPFVCERAGWAVEPARNHAYRLHLTPQRWEQAAATCRAAGGHLATITDVEEQSFVAAQAAVGFWIGGHDSKREGAFEWSTGEPFTFRRFAPGEPDDEWDTDDCVFFGPDELWHDRVCDLRNPFMCEID
jgi:cysteine-rich repeat protein